MGVGPAKKLCSFGLTICLLMLVVSATLTSNFTQRLMNVPLYETAGRLWMSKWNFSFLYFVTDYRVILTCIILAVLSYPLYKLYGILFLPMNRIRNLGDIGYVPEGRMSMRDTANRVRRQREVGDIPPVYPNGWFGLMESSNLRSGESKHVSVLGKFGIFFVHIYLSLDAKNILRGFPKNKHDSSEDFLFHQSLKKTTSQPNKDVHVQ